MQAGDNQEVTTTQNVKMTELDKLTKALCGWKEFLITAQNIFQWKETYYSFCISGFVTLSFLFWWWLNASVLTTFATLLFVVATADYVIPSLGSKLLGGKPWDGEEERQFEMVCQQILSAKDLITNYWDLMRTRKATHSKSYMSCVILVLFFVGLVGYQINNTFICYICVLFTSMFPGAYYHGIIQTWYGKACQQITIILNSKPKAKEQ